MKIFIFLHENVWQTWMNTIYTLYNVCSVHQGMFSTSGGVQYIRGISWVHRGDIMMNVGGYFQFLLKTPMYWTFPDVLNFPRCTELPPMYSWYPDDVLMISPWCTHGIPPMYWTLPNVLMIFPDVLMVSPRCTEHPLPPMYWTYPNVLNTHYTGWFTVSWYLIWF